MTSCSNGECRGMVSGAYKQCLKCRISKATHMKRMREFKRIKRESAQKERWTQKRWHEFVQSGGLVRL